MLWSMESRALFKANALRPCVSMEDLKGWGEKVDAPRFKWIHTPSRRVSLTCRARLSIVHEKERRKHFSAWDLTFEAEAECENKVNGREVDRCRWFRCQTKGLEIKVSSSRYPCTTMDNTSVIQIRIYIANNISILQRRQRVPSQRKQLKTENFFHPTSAYLSSWNSLKVLRNKRFISAFTPPPSSLFSPFETF